MSDSLTDRLEAVRTAIDTLLANPLATFESYGVSYTYQDLAKLQQMESQISARLNRRSTGSITYADTRGRT